MEKLRKNAIAVSACLALAAIAFCAVECGLALRDLRATVTGLRDPIDHINSVTLPSADYAIAQIRADAITANQVLAQGIAIEKNVNRRVTDTSQNLNALLIQAGLAADQVHLASREERNYWSHISGDTDALLQSLNAGARGLDANMDALHGILADPNIEKSIASANGILADAHSMTTDAKGTVHRVTAPPTRKQKIVSNLKELGGLTYLIFKTVSLLP